MKILQNKKLLFLKVSVKTNQKKDGNKLITADESTDNFQNNMKINFLNGHLALEIRNFCHQFDIK